MESKKILNIKGTVLDNISFMNFMEKMSASQELEKYSNFSTYPIDRLNENYLFIEKTYILLNEHIKQGIDIHPAGEWLLDNFYIIDETVQRIKKEMPKNKYRELIGIRNGNYKGFARIYLLASLIVSFRDNKIDEETLKIALTSYQKQKMLNMEEIWNLWIFLEISLIENIRGVCENIYSSQMQKYKVEEIIERVIDNKFQKNLKQKTKSNSFKNEIKYSFIEYMSYKLKKMGRRGIAYFNILEEEVSKLGFSIDEVIKKEHFNIALQKVLIGNAITSIREISRINFLMLFEEINGVEDILKKDPAQVYSKMDYKTKAQYRATIKEIAEKTKISETYIANKLIELAKEKDGKKGHIGYYLIDEGYNELVKTLGLNCFKTSSKKKANSYIKSIYIVTVLLSALFGVWLYKATSSISLGFIIGFLSIIPISEIWIQILNYLLVKIVKPKNIPKLDFQEGIPKEYSTIVAIPTIINSKQKVQELMHKLEVYYLANKTENLYFILLGDCTTSKSEKESFDEEIISEGIEYSKKLNNKYAKNLIPKFYFAYRNRTWNSGEKSFLGWERKRGLLCQFNSFLINGNNTFRVNTLEGINLNIKYVITLDADTCLPLDTAQQLVGAMAHILNEPEIENGAVVKGHAIIQPRVGIDLESSRKTVFSKIFAGDGGTDFYANAISDVYQDNFDEGIFTGKGIYDLKVFNKVLETQIPENTVLSHDLLEGSYLRAGLASDIVLIDGCPAKYNSFMQRFHRWVRGDFQLIGWLKQKIKIGDSKINNPLNKLSKFKILDNLRRGLVPVFALILIIIGLFLKIPNTFLLGLICILFPSILDLGNYIVFRKNEANVAYKNIVKTIGNLTASILRGLLELLFLPNKTERVLDAVIKSIYRLKISKQNLLEWITSEEAEKQAKTSIISYFKNMKSNFVLGLVSIVWGVTFSNIVLVLFGIAWAMAPYVACIISKERIKKEELNLEDKEYLIKIGKKTWDFFKDNINEKNNYLPPDNYQEDRKEKVATRTSPTNIGLRFTFSSICL